MRSNNGLSPLRSLREDMCSTRTERLYDKFKQMILSKELAPGYVFPNENEMCQILQIGRGTLREAYQALSTNGLISRSKAGTVVNDTDTILSIAPFNIVAEFSAFRDIFEFRMMLESESARCAALRASPEELAHLAEIVENSKGKSDPRALQEDDLEFHRLIALYSHNPLLISVFHNAWDAFEMILVKNYSRLSSISPDKLRGAVSQHEEVLQALNARDGNAALSAMRHHIYTVYDMPADSESGR